MRLFPVSLGLFLSLGASGLFAQDLHGARRAFQDELRKNGKVETAVDGLVATADPRAVDDFLDALTKLEKDLSKLRERIETKGKETRELWKQIDEQGAKGRPVSAGSATGAIKKHEALQKELAELSDQQDKFEDRQSLLRSGASRLLDRLPAESRATTLLGFASRIEKSKRIEEQLGLIEILISAAAPEAFDALAGLASSSTGAEIRTAAVEGLALKRSPRAWPILEKALADDTWTVQVAALGGLAKATNLDAVPAIIELLDKSSGRAAEEAELALVELSGKNFHDNATIWKEWWTKEGERAKAVLTELADESPLKQASAILAVKDTGLLAGARCLVESLGIGPRMPGTEPKALPPADDPLDHARREAVAEALSKSEERARGRLLADLFHRPFRAEKDIARRAAYLRAFGGVRDGSVRTLAARFAGFDPLSNPHTKEPYTDDERKTLRLAAVKGLALQGSPEVAPLLQKCLDLAKDKDLKLAIAAGLGNIRDGAAIEPLLRLLQDGEAEVVAAGQTSLNALTGENHGTDYAKWRAWWNGAKKTWKPSGPPTAAVADAAKKGGTGFYGIETKSLRIMYVLDRSGSMTANDAGKEGKTRMQAAREELIRAIRALPDDATFNLIFYNHAYEVWNKAMMPANKDNKSAAIAWVEAVDAAGNTNLFDPLERAFELAGRGAFDKAYGVDLDTIFFMSDGQPNRGRIIDPKEILKEVKRMNSLKKVKVHTIGVGDGQDEEFMRGLAELTGGQYVRR